MKHIKKNREVRLADIHRYISELENCQGMISRAKQSALAQGVEVPTSVLKEAQAKFEKSAYQTFGEKRRWFESIGSFMDRLAAMEFHEIMAMMHRNGVRFVPEPQAV